jgi:hypothetical protein
VLAAGDVDTRARRLATLEAVAEIETLPIDNAVAATWALLRVHLAEAQRRVNVNDLWIAATAVTHDLPVITHDDDFEPIAGIRGSGWFGSSFSREPGSHEAAYANMCSIGSRDDPRPLRTRPPG